MKRVADISAYFFIAAVFLLSVISILGVWDVFQTEVIYKSFLTVGLLALVAVIVIIADSFMDHHETPAPEQANPQIGTAPVPAAASVATFTMIRGATLSILIAAAVILALLGIMAIWEILEKEILNKSFASIAIIGFSSMVIVATCLQREKNPLLKNKNVSGFAILIILFTVWLLISSLF